MSSSQIDHLESIVRKSLSASDPQFRAALERVQADLLLRLSQSSPESFNLFARTLRALKKVRGSGSSSIRLTCLRHCSVFFVHHADFVSAYEAAQLQIALASQIESDDAHQRALNSMGLVQAELGNIPDALISYSEALEITRQSDDLEFEGVILNNMGTALNYGGLYRDAIPCFQRALSIAQPNWTLPVKKKALTNLAQSFYYLEQFHDGLEVIEEALSPDSSFTTASQHFDQALREFTLVQIALELNNKALAIDHALLCKEHANLANSVSRTLMADIASCRCEIRYGDTQRGLARLDNLVGNATKIDSMYKDALIAAVQANDDAGRPDLALMHMEQLIAHVRERRTTAIQALLAVPGVVITQRFPSSWQVDLLALETKHARLRARVAEREANVSQWEMLERLAMAADLKEDASGGHGHRVGRISGMLARRIGMASEAASSLETAARLHDIGKLGIPDKILSNSEALKHAERNFMCMHAAIGAELLGQSSLPQLKLAEMIARCHHEWWNGDGYPAGLTATRIPLEARIVAICDVFDALTHDRPFSEAWSADRALEEISHRRGIQFEPMVTDRFLSLIHELRCQHQNLDGLFGPTANGSPFTEVRKRIRALVASGQSASQALDAI